MKNNIEEINENYPTDEIDYNLYSVIKIGVW